ncbi:MAG TPA: phosphoribosylamine--glycine ligase [Coriobacteriia bacterium]|jgi:phosphoribosylamine--glycine ligase
MRVLVLGGGGREHAIVRKLVESPQVKRVFCAPGNGGTAPIAENVAGVDIEDPKAVADLALALTVDLVVIGPEGPLVEGVADEVAGRYIRVFGPKRAGARLEGSKDFAKRVMERTGIRTGAYAVFDDIDAALGYVRDVGAPIVVKADGLAAGKGVTVAMNLPAAEEAVHECLEGRFGEAGRVCLVEEYLEGPECSLLAFTDGKTVRPMLPVQDHKRAFDHDSGPNTGGMGAYTPVPAVDAATLDEMVEVLQRTVGGLNADGIDFRGVLYGGFVLTDEGPKVLEYNARFGDPETQVILPMLQTDLMEVFVAVADGKLDEIELEWRDGACVTVVMASGGYPGSYEMGKVITGISEAEGIEGVTVYHAGTAVDDDGRLVTTGGRVLNVTAVGASIAEARDRAYAAVSLISFEGMHYRTDIATRALPEGPVDWTRH